MNSVKSVNKQTKNLQVSKIIKTVRKKYVRCITIKTLLEVYKKCLDKYNDLVKSLEKYNIVSYNVLKQKQYKNKLELENSQYIKVLKLFDCTKINYLLKEIKQYIDTHSQKFNNYLCKIKVKSKYLKTIKHIIRNETNLNKH